MTERPGDQGFRVSNGTGKAFAFVVNNGAAEVRVGYTLQVASVVHVGDVGTVGARTSGAVIGAVGGALRVALHAPPQVTGS